MKEDSRSSLVHRLRDALEHVSRSPGGFFLVLLALRTLFRPYAGITHDAKLYALQVMHRATPGVFSGDLYLQYGSQDNYSLFSTLMAPLTATLGLEGSLWLAFVASTAFVIYAELRLVRCLLGDRLAANVALVLLAVTDLPYAGRSVFHVHESFLTGRPAAVALTLLGLEQLLRRRFFASTLLMLAAMALHPLMAIGGLFVVAASFCMAKLPSRVVLSIAVTGVLATVAVLLYRPLGVRLFGYIDPVWYDILYRRNPHLFPSAWWMIDWWRIAFSLVIVIAGGKYLDRRFTGVVRLVVLLALASVLGSVIAEVCPYALLLQGQPLRGLWLLQFLAVPLGVLLTVRLWQQETGVARLGSIAVGCFTGRLLQQGNFEPASMLSTVTILAGLLMAFALIYRSRLERPAVADWLWPAMAASLVGCAVLTSLGSVLSIGRLMSAGFEDPLRLLWLIPRECSDAVVALTAIVLIAALWAATKDVRRAGLAAAAVWIGFSAAVFCIRNDTHYRDAFVRDHVDVAFVRQCLQQYRQDGQRIPAVYWPTDVIHVWFGLPATSFYSWEQTVGSLFNRETAMEGQRRLSLVLRFEIARMRAISDVGGSWTRLLIVCGADLREPAPTKEDLLRLCREQAVDFIVLSQQFEGLAAETNGRVFVYDCRSIRANSRESSERAAVSVAAAESGSS